MRRLLLPLLGALGCGLLLFLLVWFTSGLTQGLVLGAIAALVMLAYLLTAARRGARATEDLAAQLAGETLLSVQPAALMTGNKEAPGALAVTNLGVYFEKEKNGEVLRMPYGMLRGAVDDSGFLLLETADGNRHRLKPDDSEGAMAAIQSGLAGSAAGKSGANQSRKSG